MERDDIEPRTDAASVDEAFAVVRGTNQAGMRAQNERLVLTLVRRHGRLTKAELARMTGLSAQTVSVIMRSLEADRLLRRGEPRRGRVGQPSVPLSLDPDGAFFLGAKIGRRSLDVVLVDFLGTIRHRTRETYDLPRPDRAVARIRAEVEARLAALGAAAGRVAGLGIAMPFELWNWASALGAPPDDIAAWREVDVRTALAAELPFPVYLQNDATAACGAELAFGASRSLSDFIYFYVGSFVGGGVVLNGGLMVGRTGNAGAVGSMPVPGPGGTEQLIDQASLVVLERRLRAARLPAEALFEERPDWDDLEPWLGEWLAVAGRGLAHAVVAAAAVVDFEAAVIDGSMPPPVKARLIAGVAEAVAGLETAGIAVPELRAGSLGPIARALGGASLPLFDRYLVETTPETAQRAEVRPAPLGPDWP